MDTQPMFEPIIGTLNEHTLHLALKNLMEPDPQYHEISYKGFVADILHGNEIVEIETRSFENMKRKLSTFLEAYSVTLVYPIAVHKSVGWIDPETGERSSMRKSPKKGRPIDVMRELYKLSPYLLNPRFRLKLVLCDMEEYRHLNGWSRDRKRGATRADRIPIRFLESVEVSSLSEYVKLVDVIPNGEFTAAEFGRANRIKGRHVWYTLQILMTVGAIERSGKQGRAFLYKRIDSTESD